jgi:hypothetical protein
MSEKKYVSPGYEQQLTDLAETLRADNRERLVLETAITAGEVALFDEIPEEWRQ